MSTPPSALPLPKAKTHFDLAGALVEGFLGGALRRRGRLVGRGLAGGSFID
jgi:hypothetical protein